MKNQLPKQLKVYTALDMVNFLAFNEFEADELTDLSSQQRLKKFKKWNKN